MTVREPAHLEVVNALAAAMVASSNAPLLMLDGELNVIEASRSFCQAFGIAPGAATGRSLSNIGTGEWNVPQLAFLLSATASGRADIDAYEFDLKRVGVEARRLIVNARKLDYGVPEHVRLLLTVTDVTDARLADKQRDDLLREKAILLQELQHRVANSLQIIASVLMQSARRVQSDETRAYLQDAHQRVMSVASLQRQLAASSLEDVELKPYLTELCRSIAASMIRDHDELDLKVNADDSLCPPNTSVSLGLIVTELVINALKHGFPGHRKGHIEVDYHSAGKSWTLAVVDSGVGIPTDAEAPKPGLGTSIVQALANQLEATVEISSANPGMRVTIQHG